MSTEPITISPTTKAALIELAERTGRPAAELLDAAVESLRRSLVEATPIASIPGVDPAEVWEAASQADAGCLRSHAETFADLRRRQ